MFGGVVNAVLLYQSRRRVLVFCVIISIAGHFGMLSGFYFCSRAVQAGPAAPGYWGHFLLIPGAEVGAVFIPVPAGFGAFEGLVARSYHGRESRPREWRFQRRPPRRQVWLRHWPIESSRW